MSQNNKKILIVDDDELICMTFVVFFQSENYIIDTAATGEDALIKLKSTQYDLIISDIVMPVCHGIELFMKVRETSNIPFILMSGDGAIGNHTHTETISNLSNTLNLTGHIKKPFDIKKLRYVIKSVLLCSESDAAIGFSNAELDLIREDDIFKSSKKKLTY